MDKLLTVRMSEEDRARWGGAAEEAGLSLSAWVRRSLDWVASGPTVIEYKPPTEADAEEIRRLAEELRARPSVILPAPAKKSKGPLCENCRRKGDGVHPLPACKECN